VWAALISRDLHRELETVAAQALAGSFRYELVGADLPQAAARFEGQTIESCLSNRPRPTAPRVVHATLSCGATLDVSSDHKSTLTTHLQMVMTRDGGVKIICAADPFLDKGQKSPRLAPAIRGCRRQGLWPRAGGQPRALLFALDALDRHRGLVFESLVLFGRGNLLQVGDRDFGVLAKAAQSNDRGAAL